MLTMCVAVDAVLPRRMAVVQPIVGAFIKCWVMTCMYMGVSRSGAGGEYPSPWNLKMMTSYVVPL